MPKLPGIQHRRAVKAFKKAGFIIAREGKAHIVMRREHIIVTIPRNNPINAYTLGGIIRDAGLTVEEFKNLL